MAPQKRILTLVLSLLATLAASQRQAVLQNGNSQLPTCAQTCPLLIQASQACNGATSASQAVWVCFCQSAYLNTLRQSAAGICDSTCTSASDLQQVSTWYSSNCGSDNGASEHAGNGGSASSVSGNNAPSSAATPVGSSSSSSSSSDGSGTSSNQHQDWWSGHYQWIIMLIVLAIVLPAIGLLAHWFKRRHDRKRDQITSGFNDGITSRSGPMAKPDANNSGVAGSGIVEGSGRNSPARTRDAFMPYGYGYSRSESRLESQQAFHDDRRSPLAHAETPDAEKEAAMGSAETPQTQASKRRSRRVLVRERSAQDSIEPEKRPGE